MSNYIYIFFYIAFETNNDTCNVISLSIHFKYYLNEI